MKSQAVEADRQAIVENGADPLDLGVGVDHERARRGQVAHYRVLHAQADAIEDTDPEEALTLRATWPTGC